MSSRAPRIVFAAANVTAGYGDLVLCDTAAGGFIVTLPRPSIGLGPIEVKKTADSTNNVTVARSGTALIDGATSVVLVNYNQTVTLVPNGTNWVVTASVAGSTPSASVPGAPTIGTAAAGILSAGVAFTPPVSDGGSAITGYTATSSPGGITGTGASSPITVPGLTAGTPYTFTVHATNAVGNSAESAASNSVTPSASATAPGAPTIGTATAGNAQAVANWTAPASNGGSAVTGYTVKTYDSSGTLLATDTTGVVLTYTKTGLTNGAGVKFKVAATNAIGTGTLSAFSNTVTPVAPGAADNFDRANENPLATSSGGQAWVHPTFGKFKVVSNKAQANTGSGTTLSVMESGLADFTLSVDIDLIGAGDQSVPFRVVDISNYWICCFFGGTLYLRKVVAGSASWVGGFPSAPTSGLHTLGIVCAGSSIDTFIDSVAKHAATDAFNATATLHGLSTGNFSEDLTSTWDNFSVTP